MSNADTDSAPEPIPIEALYDQTRVSDLALSPDGERVAYVTEEFDEREDDRRRSVWVVPADGSRDPHRLTRASDASAPAWSPDGSRLAVLAARERDVELAVAGIEDDEEDGGEGTDADDDGSENGNNDGGDGNGGDADEPKPQVWTFDLELGGDARQVTDREEGVREFDWGPEGERFIVAARDPTDDEREYLDGRRDGGPIETERLQHKVNGQGWLDTVTTYLFVVEVESREQRRLDDAYGSGAFEPLAGLEPTWISEDEIAFLSNRSGRPDDSAAMDLYLVDSAGGEATRVTEGELTVRAIEPAPTGSDARLAFAAGDPENPCVPTQVYAWDGENDRAGDEYESLTADLDRTLTWGASLRWIDEGTLVTAIADEAHTRLYRVGVDSTTERLGTDVAEEASIPAFDYQNGTVALVRSHPAEGLDVYTTSLDALDTLDDERSGDGADSGKRDSDERDSDAGNGELRRVTALNDEFPDEHATPVCRRVSYESEGSEESEIDAIYYSPPDFEPREAESGASESRPLVVSIHGGPISYDAPEWRFEYAVLASRGYVVLCPNYRGGSSYGREFAEELYGEWGTVEVEDITAGIDALVERGWVDPDRVFGRGFSYGGIAQGYLVTQTDALTAAVPEHGIYDLRSAFGTDDTHVRMESEFGLPWDERETFEAASSITQAGNIDTPLLVMAGGEDWRCPSSQSEQLYVSARKQGVPAKLVLYPDEHHDVGDPDRATHRLRELTAWYERFDPAQETSEE